MKDSLNERHALRKMEHSAREVANTMRKKSWFLKISRIKKTVQDVVSGNGVGRLENDTMEMKAFIPS